MRTSYKAVILAALEWQEVYERDDDAYDGVEGTAYDGVEGCVARAKLSIAIDKMIEDEVSRTIAKARKRAPAVVLVVE